MHVVMSDVPKGERQLAHETRTAFHGATSLKPASNAKKHFMKKELTLLGLAALAAGGLHSTTASGREKEGPRTLRSTPDRSSEIA
jgi:hypothetical protein